MLYMLLLLILIVALLCSVITIAQHHSIKPRGVLEIRDLRQWSRLEIKDKRLLSVNHTKKTIHQFIISALLFGWMYVIPFLKGNGINKKPIINDIDFQVTISKWCIVNAPKSFKQIDFWNSVELSSWILKRTFLSF